MVCKDSFLLYLFYLFYNFLFTVLFLNFYLHKSEGGDPLPLPPTFSYHFPFLIYCHLYIFFFLEKGSKNIFWVAIGASLGTLVLCVLAVGGYCLFRQRFLRRKALDLEMQGKSSAQNVRKKRKLPHGSRYVGMKEEGERRERKRGKKEVDERREHSRNPSVYR